MATIDDVLAIQSQYSILQAPTDASSVQGATEDVKLDVAATTPTLQVALTNNTTSSNVWAYVSGLDINNNNAVYLLQSDGKTVYHPTSPGSIGSPLTANCNIKLGPPGSTTTITIPQTAGGRFWFCQDNQLVFKLNPGPALVEPSVTNPSDPNYNFTWDFCEFTYNTAEVFANITYVDFVSMPIALNLQTASGATYSVPGMPSTGLNSVCSQLAAQTAKDGAGWGSLVVKGPSGANLRALSPNSGIVMNNSLFSGYYQPYVNAVWAKYSSSPLTVDTQVQWGTLTGQVVNNQLTFAGAGGFPQPSAADIFSCSSGAFGAYSTNTAEMGNITARLAAAFNRSTLLINSDQPDGEQVSTFYQNSITNHYARIVHSVNAGGLGYAFPYDDVAASSSQNVAGTVADPNPTLLTITIGGSNVSTRNVNLRELAHSGGRRGQQVGGRRFGRIRRALDWSSSPSETEPAQEMREVHLGEEHPSTEVDLEKGELALLPQAVSSKLDGELSRLAQQQPQAVAMARSLGSLVPASVAQRVGRLLERVEGSAAYAYAKPAADVVVRAVMALLSLSVRTVLSRGLMVLFLLLCSFLLGFFGRGTSSALDYSRVLVDGVDVAV